MAGPWAVPSSCPATSVQHARGKGPRLAALRGAAGLLALAASSLGCGGPVTEIVVVVDTDLTAPADFDALMVQLDSGFGENNVAFATNVRFPATLGLIPEHEGNAPFDLSVTLTSSGLLAVKRSASEVRFVKGETRMLFVGLSRTCQCQGTSCPDPRTAPLCARLVDPPLAPFDPDHLPHL
jgi:hypothetical protein